MKKLVLLLISIVIIAGCFNKKINQNDNKERIYLSSEYYNKGEFLEVDNLDNLSDKTYIVFTYNNFCNMSVPCDKIFESFMEKYSIDFLKISFENFKNSPFYNEVKYAPSVIIINNEKIIICGTLEYKIITKSTLRYKLFNYYVYITRNNLVITKNILLKIYRFTSSFVSFILCKIPAGQA